MARAGDSPELEIVCVEEQKCSAPKLKGKLLEFLFHEPPPTPLEWSSFRAHVVGRFSEFYPVDILNDVFSQIVVAVNQKKKNEEIITIDSDDCDGSIPEQIFDTEEDENSSSDDEHSNYEPTMRSTTSLDGNRPKSNVTINKRTLTADEWATFRAGSAVKKCERYLKEVYTIITEIRDTTSCSVCVKLKTRITKFRNHLSESSCDLFKTSRNSSTAVDGPVGSSQKKTKKKKTDSVSEGDKMTEEDAESVGVTLLVDKIMELSTPVVIRSAERLCSSREKESSTKRDKRKTSNASDCSTPADSTGETKFKKKRKKRSTPLAKPSRPSSSASIHSNSRSSSGETNRTLILKAGGGQPERVLSPFSPHVRLERFPCENTRQS